MGAVYLLDQDEKVLRLVAQQGIPADVVAYISTIPLGADLVGWVAEYGEPVLVPDVTSDPRGSRLAQAKGLRTFVGAPMRARGHTIGALSVLGVADQQYTLEEVALLASIADQVGVAVENAQLRQQAEHAAVREERERLARDLHDSVTQSLYSLALFAEAGGKVADAENYEPLKYHFKRIGETAQQALKEMRLLVHELRPLDLEQEGLVGALHRRLNAVEGRVNIKARLVAEDLVQLAPAMEQELYHIAQEALNNALKHAGATQVIVYLRTEGGRVELEIADNGIGFDASLAGDGAGMGLVNMRERAARLGGALSVHSSPGQGTQVKVSVKAPGNEPTEVAG
jgi:signal transduction histidine kinase